MGRCESFDSCIVVQIYLVSSQSVDCWRNGITRRVYAEHIDYFASEDYDLKEDADGIDDDDDDGGDNDSKGGHDSVDNESVAVGMASAEGWHQRSRSLGHLGRALPVSTFGETNDATCWPNSPESRSMLQQYQRSVAYAKERKKVGPTSFNFGASWHILCLLLLDFGCAVPLIFTACVRKLKNRRFI